MSSLKCFVCLSPLPSELKGTTKRKIVSTLNNLKIEIDDLLGINNGGSCETDKDTDNDNSREQLVENLSVCLNCVDPIKLVVSSKFKVDKVETTVRKLQVDLLKQLKKLEQCLEVLGGELEVIGGIVQNSGDRQSKLANYVDELPDNVGNFRKDILEVHRQLQKFKNVIKTGTSTSANFPDNQNSSDIPPQKSIEMKIKTEPTETNDFNLNNYIDDPDDAPTTSMEYWDDDDHRNGPSDIEVPPSSPPISPETNPDPPADSKPIHLTTIKRKYYRLQNKCPNCSETFTLKSSLSKHQKIHHPNARLQEILPCPHCHESMARQLLRTHKLHHCPSLKKSKPTTFPCTICKGIGFQTVESLKDHNLEEHVEKLSKMCETCGKISASRQAHEMHQNTHVDPRDREVVECDDCGKMILTTSIDSHRRLGCPKRETGSFLCQFCQKYFSNESNLGKHVRRMHKGRKMDEGDEDDEEDGGGPVKPMDHRRKIMVIAEEDEDDKLDDRGRGEDSDPDFIPSKDKTDEKVNRKSRRKRRAPMKCPKCPRTFTLSRDLKKHKISRHKNDYLSESIHCPHCLETMARKLLRTHLFYHCPVKSKDITYSCTLCKPSVDDDLDNYRNPIFPDLDSLKSHVASQHPRKLSLICEICGVISSSLDSHLKHQVRHVDPKDRKFVECEACGKSILSTSVSSHKRFGCPKREVTKFPCVYCPKLFSTEMAVGRHVSRWHTGVNGEVLVKPRRPKQLQCHLCGKWIQDKAAMRRHLRSAHQSWEERDDKSVCEFCGKEMLTVSLGQHEKYHCTGKERVKGEGITCEICGKSFNLKETLWWHRKVVHGNDKFVCEICGKVFKAKSGYKKHLEGHAGVRKFVCGLGCGRRFTQKHHLQKHLRLAYCVGEKGPRKQRRSNLEIEGRDVGAVE